MPKVTQKRGDPEDTAARLLESAWDEYFYLFGVTVNGTFNQIRAMLCLKGGKKIVRAVNLQKKLLVAAKEVLRWNYTRSDEQGGTFKIKAHENLKKLIDEAEEK